MEESRTPDESTSSHPPASRPPAIDAAHAIFANALELPERERDTFIRRACAGDAELEALVHDLLTADARIESDEIFTARMESRDLSGTVIGRYRVLSLLGEGGFGYVYSAEQREPVERTVALKIIKLGMDTRQVIARFEAERQALALMDHPNIARVFDGGSTDTGRPYFVMELVKGLPITEYCDNNKLTIEERLELFATVCDAVQHAHQKGVIHRDIKPSNVLVTVGETSPVPKVIDFGVAKAINARLTDKTVHTELSQMIGTPEYMSPEQAGTSALDIDTRSDVYSLGVLLYELLTGTTPFAGIHTAGYAEIQRIIREVDPTRPSTRLSTLDGLAGVAASRKLEPRRLGSRLNGDLDWIVLKTLEKDRTRRYETASALATDIRRHLRDEPVEAGPPSATYRVGKFVRRNRGQVIAAGIVAATLVVASIISLRFGLIAKRAQADLLDRAQELERVVAFQDSQLSGVDPQAMGTGLREDLILEARTTLERSGEEDREARLDAFDAMLEEANLTNVALRLLDRSIFDRSIATINAQFADQPRVRARLLHTLARTLQALGLGEDAIAPQRAALDLRRATLGEDDPQTLVSQGSLALLLQDQGRFEDAEAMWRDALERSRRVLGEDDPEIVTLMTNIGMVMSHRGDLRGAEAFLRAELERGRKVLGPDHPTMIRLSAALGGTLLEQQRLDDAEPLLLGALETSRRVQGSEHAETLSILSNVGTLRQRQQRFGEAEQYFLESLKLQRALLGDDHADTIGILANVGVLLRVQGRLDDAEPYYVEAMERSIRVLGEHNPLTATCINNVGRLRSQQERLDEAMALYKRALQIRRRTLGQAAPDTLTSMNNLCALLMKIGQVEEAERMAATAVRTRRESGAGSDLLFGALLSKHGKALLLLERYEEAEAGLTESFDVLSDIPGQEHRRDDVVRDLVTLYEDWHAIESGAGYEAKAAEWRAQLSSSG